MSCRVGRPQGTYNREQWFLTKGDFVPQECLEYSETSLVVRTGLRECYMHTKLLQSCLTLCNPMGCSLPGSSVPGIFQARILECIAMPFSMDLPNQGIKPASLMSPALARGFITTSTTWKAQESVQFSCSVVSDSVRPYRWEPIRLLRPWDFPGKNTGVGSHFLFQCIKVKSESEVIQSCPTLSDPMDYSLPGSVHGILQARILEWVVISFSKNIKHT